MLKNEKAKLKKKKKNFPDFLNFLFFWGEIFNLRLLSIVLAIIFALIVQLGFTISS